ncbi:MAG: DNA-directed RNA polymerase subunit omega [Candidatus Omnitrophica bacterium]|nr:DNA-directed RNA polymerase subunit omega [Candidatus Omnitrophota bacterium]
MAGNIPLEELLQQGGSLYKLVLLASKRALELSEGAPRLVDLKHPKVSTVALQEIREGKVAYVIPQPKDKKGKKEKK